MRIDHRHLLGLPVVTELGSDLGKVKGIVIDTDTHAIVHYEVARTFSRSCLFVMPVCVVSITLQKMVVKDTVEKISNGKKIAHPISTSPALYDSAK